MVVVSFVDEGESESDLGAWDEILRWEGERTAGDQWGKARR